MRIFIVVLFGWIAIGCDIEGAIGNASQRCEDEIAKIIQSIESSCLTKDELFDILDSVRARNDQTTNCDVGD